MLKRNFYLVLTVLRKFSGFNNFMLIEMFFPESDVKEHLVSKLNEKTENYKSINFALLALYEGLDTEHQAMFDKVFNEKMDILEAKTTPYA